MLSHNSLRCILSLLYFFFGKFLCSKWRHIKPLDALTYYHTSLHSSNTKQLFKIRHLGLWNLSGESSFRAWGPGHREKSALEIWILAFSSLWRIIFLYLFPNTSEKPEQPDFPSSLPHAPGESITDADSKFILQKRKMVIIFQLSGEKFHLGDFILRCFSAFLPDTLCHSQGCS